MGELKFVEVAGRDRQHVHLHLPAGILIFLQQMQARLQVAVSRFQLLAVAPVLQTQARTIERSTDRVFEHRQIFEGLDQIISCAQSQSLDGIAHHTCT